MAGLNIQGLDRLDSLNNDSLTEDELQNYAESVELIADALVTGMENWLSAHNNGFVSDVTVVNSSNPYKTFRRSNRDFFSGTEVITNGRVELYGEIQSPISDYLKNQTTTDLFPTLLIGSGGNLGKVHLDTQGSFTLNVTINSDGTVNDDVLSLVTKTGYNILEQPNRTRGNVKTPSATTIKRGISAVISDMNTVAGGRGARGSRGFRAGQIIDQYLENDDPNDALYTVEIQVFYQNEDVGTYEIHFSYDFNGKWQVNLYDDTVVDFVKDITEEPMY